MAHSRFRYLNCQAFQPNRWTSIALAICRDVRCGGWSWRADGAPAARGAAMAVRVTAAAGAGSGRLVPLTRAALLVVVLARAVVTITAPASARVIGIGMR